jgi:NADPH-dependent 2,4-dienoyl-CoA reductase/sulfur reductase-like enzyme
MYYPCSSRDAGGNATGFEIEKRCHMETAELAIIGAGPGGLAALEEAVRHGLSVALFDDNALPGGQYFRQIPSAFRTVSRSSFDKAGSVKPAFLFRLTTHPSVRYMPDTIVWGFFEDKRIAYTSSNHQGLIRADNIIISIGAFDRPIPFPGWTLPGVFTAGGVQNLIVGQRIIPGRNVLISGNGVLNFAVAYNLHKAGCKVVEILETSKQSLISRKILKLLSDTSLLYRGLCYRATLLSAGIPIRKGRIVVEAHGEDRVEEVVTAPIDSSGRVDYSRSRSVKVDTLVVGFGLVPSIEMTRLLGCEHRYDPLEGSFIPVRSTEFETSVPGVFVVGDCAGTRGGEVALMEGRLAGLSVAARLGRVSQQEAADIRSPLLTRLARISRFQSGIKNLFMPPKSFLSLLTEDTVICRCEDVTFGQLKEWVHKGIFEMSSLKSLTRIGMGRCQGRNCFGTFAAIMAQELRRTPSDLIVPRVRHPLKPIRLGDLLKGELPPPSAPEMKLI